MKCKNAKWVLPLACSLLFTPIQAQEPGKIKLPDMGDSAGTLISPIEEKKLGDAFFRNLHSEIKINNDPEIQQYIQAIGQRLVTNSDTPGSPFHFFVVIDKSINAFAGPGGYIGINSGLLITTESESEMASVMAHEVAHVTQRHLYRAFEAASQLSLPTAAAMLAAILLGTQNAELGLAALTAIQAGSIQLQINFTRSNEQEADRIGMQTLVRSDFNPRSMPVFLNVCNNQAAIMAKESLNFCVPIRSPHLEYPIPAAEQKITLIDSIPIPKITCLPKQNYALIRRKIMMI